MIADRVVLTNLGTMDDFNSQVLDAIRSQKFIDPPHEAGVKRSGFIFNVEDNNDNIDYSVNCLTDVFGSPYEKFTNLTVGECEVV